MSVPAERFPTALAAVGPRQQRQLWAVANEAFCVWKADGSFVSSFAPGASTLGRVQSVAAVGDEHALVASTHGITLWHIVSKPKQKIMFYSSLNRALALLHGRGRCHARR